MSDILLPKSVAKSTIDQQKLLQAIIYAKKHHTNNSKYLLEIAEIVAAIYTNPDATIAGILWFAVQNTSVETANVRYQEISSLFGDKVVRIVRAVNKLQVIDYVPYNDFRSQKFFDILATMQEEVSTALVSIKLAYLLHNVSVFTLNPTGESYATTALTIMEIYLPLLDKFGLTGVKAELQEFCLKILQSDTREYIETYLNDAILSNGAGELVRKIASNLNSSLKKHDIQAEIQGRVKSPYSIWSKMLKKSIDIKQLHDILAFRIIVDDIEECYKVLEIICKEYRIIIERFKDYIQKPKASGYQSLHTIIISPFNRKKIELQIRTKTMHQAAEHGVAAHWQYKGRILEIKDKLQATYQYIHKAVYVPVANLIHSFNVSEQSRLVSQHGVHYVHQLKPPAHNVDGKDVVVNNYYYNKKPITGFTLVTSRPAIDKTQEVQRAVIIPDTSSHLPKEQIYNLADNLHDSRLANDFKVERVKANSQYEIVAVPRKEGEVIFIAQNMNTNLFKTMKEADIIKKDQDIVVTPEEQTVNQPYVDPVQKTKEELQDFFRAVEKGDVATVINFINKLGVHIINEPDETDGKTALIKAIEYDEEGIVDLLLKHPSIDIDRPSLGTLGGINLACSNSPHSTGNWIREDHPLFVAIQGEGGSPLVERLLKEYTDIKKLTDNNGSTVLMIAAKYGDVKILALLIKRLKCEFADDMEGWREYLNLTDNDINNNSALDYAFDRSASNVEEGIKMIRMLLDVQDRDGHRLVENSALQKVFFAAVAAKDDQTQGTPCDMEIGEWPKEGITQDEQTQGTPCDMEIGEWPKEGITQDEQTRDISQDTDIDEFPGEEIIEEITEDKAGKEKMIDLIESLLTKYDIDVRGKNSSDQTALMIAIERGNVEVLELLIKYLQDAFKDDIEVLREYLNLTDKEYNSALAYTYHPLDEEQGAEMRRILLSVRDEDGCSLVQEVEVQIVAPLIDIARDKQPVADINQVDDNGDTALITAVHTQNLAMVELLLKEPNISINQKSADISKGTWVREGELPFLLAVQLGNALIVQEFLKYSGLDIYQKNQDEQTALIIAAEYGNVEVLRLLIEYLQDAFKDDIEVLQEYLHLTDSVGKSALAYACDYCRLDKEQSIEMRRILLAVDYDFTDSLTPLPIYEAGEGEEGSEHLVTQILRDSGFHELESEESSLLAENHTENDDQSFIKLNLLGDD